MGGRRFYATVALGSLLVTAGCGHSGSSALPPLVLGPTPAPSSLSVLAGNSGGPGNLNGNTTLAAFNHPTAVVTDSNGTIFVADTFNNSIRKVSPQGVVSLFAGGVQGYKDGTGTQAEFNGPSAIAIDSNNNLYVADTNNNNIREITPAGVVTTLAGDNVCTFSTTSSSSATSTSSSSTTPSTTSTSSSSTTPSNLPLQCKSGNSDGIGNQILFKAPAGIAVDSSNNLYVSDTGNQILRELSFSIPYGASVPAWVSTTLSITIAGTYTPVTFSTPLALVPDAQGNLFVADSGNHVIRIIQCGINSTLCSTPSVATPVLSTPVGLALAPNSSTPSTLYVSDAQSHAIYSLDVSYSGSTATLASTATVVAGTAGTPGFMDGSNNLLNAPMGLSLYNGTLYFADTGNNAIRSWSAATAVKTMAGSPALQGVVNGAGTAALFMAPNQLATDAAGNVYVADSGNNCIRKITPAGVVSTLAGGGASGQSAGLADGQGSNALFNHPVGIALDSQGNVFVADYNNDDIRKITPQGLVSTVAGVGYAAYLDSTGTAAAFYNPIGLAVDATNNIYVADAGSNTIRRITPQGQVSTIAGQGGSSGNLDGSGTAALFNHPGGIAIDSKGNIYVADSGNNSIRQISGNQVTTIGGLTSGYVDGPVATAEFNAPSQLAVDQQGNIYIADTMNNVIRKINTSGTVSTLVGTSGSTGNQLSPFPGSLYQPLGLALDRQGHLLISSDQAILMTH